MNKLERKLYNLINEDDIVKNKKTGNVYSVKQMDPAKHDKPTPDEIEATKQKPGGKVPTTDPAAKPDKEKSTAPPAGQQKAEPKKIGAADFKTDAEKDSKKSISKDKETEKQKSLMPGMDTTKKGLDDISPIERQKISAKVDELAKLGAEAKAKGEKAPKVKKEKKEKKEKVEEAQSSGSSAEFDPDDPWA